MSFLKALELVKHLEGRGRKGELYGVEQGTWERLGFRGSVEQASDSAIASVYRKLWDECRCENPEAGATQPVFDMLPEPADAVAFQMFINLPWKAFHRILQTVVGVEPDGVFGAKTFYAIRTAVALHRALPEVLLVEQGMHYKATAQPEYVDGLLNRVQRVREWLKGD